MIAEHGEGRFGLAHSPRNPQNFSLLGPTINKITDKDDFSTRAAEHAFGVRVSEFCQQSTQSIRVAVDVTYYVVPFYVVPLVRHRGRAFLKRDLARRYDGRARRSR
jgi:hypothetical protein